MNNTPSNISASSSLCSMNSSAWKTLQSKIQAFNVAIYQTEPKKNSVILEGDFAQQVYDPQLEYQLCDFQVLDANSSETIRDKPISKNQQANLQEQAQNFSFIISSQDKVITGKRQLRSQEKNQILQAFAIKQALYNKSKASTESGSQLKNSHSLFKKYFKQESPSQIIK